MIDDDKHIALLYMAVTDHRVAADHHCLTPSLSWFVAIIAVAVIMATVAVAVIERCMAIIVVAVSHCLWTVIVMFCGRHYCGHCCCGPSLTIVWPSLSQFVAIIVAVVVVAVIDHRVAINAVAVIVCGRHCHGLWPSLLWSSLSLFVAIMVCGRCCCGRHCLSVAIIDEPRPAGVTADVFSHYSALYTG